MENHVESALAFGRRKVTVHPQSLVHILDIYYGVIHKASYRDCYAAETHCVDGDSESMEHQHGNDNRKRKRHNGNYGGADVHQEDEKNDNHEQCAFEQSFAEVRHGGVDEVALAEYLRIDMHVRRE